MKNNFNIDEIVKEKIRERLEIILNINIHSLPFKEAVGIMNFRHDDILHNYFFDIHIRYIILTKKELTNLLLQFTLSHLYISSCHFCFSVILTDEDAGRLINER